jgi:hypothetical protein
MSHKLFELDVRLRQIEPPIWRTIEVAGDSSLEDVHFAIQVAMGWTNSHLHQFEIDDVHYGMVVVDERHDLEDEREVSLQDIVQRGSSFVYEYDFGDGWEHDVTVTKVSTVAKLPRSRCVGGGRACPPEDCGGPGGYAHLLHVLAHPEHAEHQSLVAWADGFDPERFSLPKNGHDLRVEMARLKQLADGANPESDGASGPFDLPKSLIDAVLALPPMERASLVAVIAGSLAEDVHDAYSVVDELAAASRARRTRHGARKRTRS